MYCGVGKEGCLYLSLVFSFVDSFLAMSFFALNHSIIQIYVHTLTPKVEKQQIRRVAPHRLCLRTLLGATVGGTKKSRESCARACLTIQYCVYVCMRMLYVCMCLCMCMCILYVRNCDNDVINARTYASGIPKCWCVRRSRGARPHLD